MKPATFATLFFGTLAVTAGLLFAIHAPIFSGPPAERVEGRQLYAMNCAGCHGASGRSLTAPDLASADFLAITPLPTLEAMIAEGRPSRGMPAWSTVLKPEGVRAVAAYIKEWQTSPDIDLPRGRIHGDIEAGERLFAAVCAACHGPDGVGGSAPALNHPAFLNVASDHYLRATIVTGREGTPMRSFEGAQGLANLTSREIDAVVAYIRSWQ